jgi:pimeloyl-ACP methyl ester carboxylesterase
LVIKQRNLFGVQKYMVGGKIMNRLLFFICLFIGYLLIGYFVSGCAALEFRTSDKVIYEQFGEKGVQPEFFNYDHAGRNIHFASVGNSCDPMIIFVHGSPGSLDNFLYFLKDERLYANYHIISVDRPGFGYSDFGEGEEDLASQTEALLPLLELTDSGHPPVLVGHSLGGPVIAKMAMDCPEKVGGLMFLASSVAAEYEPSNWYRYLLEFPPIRYLVPKSFQASNTEILHLKKALQTIEDDWKNINVPSVVIHGTTDRFVPVENADFLKDRMVSTEVKLLKLEGEDHFLPWSQQELIVKELRSLMIKVTNNY